MAYQMTVTLTDAEYHALSAEAAKSGKALDALLHEMLAQHIQPPSTAMRTPTSHEIQEYLYQEGIIEHIPTKEPDTPEEEAGRERLAHFFGKGKLASEMVIEDRGPR